MNSKAKGNRGEAMFRKYLIEKCGFVHASVCKQGKGGPNDPDVKCDDLPGIHFEVKHGDEVTFGNAALMKALRQARREAPAYRAIEFAVTEHVPVRPIVAFHNTGKRQWWLAWMGEDGEPQYQECTKAALVRLNGERK